MSIRFTIYGDELFTGITLEELIAAQEKDGLFWARAENSGSESTYCEVARWNHTTVRWERFCFAKCLDHRLPDAPDASDKDTAIALANMINLCNETVSIVHSMPNYVVEQQ